MSESQPEFPLPWVLVADPIHASALKVLESSARVDVQVGRTADELMDIIGTFDGMVVRSATQVTRDIIEAASQLRVIARAGVGVDNIDVEAATEHGILVVNAAGANSSAVAELAIALMIDLLRHVVDADVSMKAGKWEKKRLQGRQLGQQTVGVIGYGNVGREVARLLVAFGARVLVYTRPEQVIHFGERADLDRLLAESQIVSLHASATDGRPIIDREAIARMRDGAYLVNTARGQLIDEDALLEALDSGKVAGAALDVFRVEPPIDVQLVRHPRVICTPHIGASTVAAQQAVGLIAVRALLDVLAGRPAKTAINPEAAYRR